MSAGMAPDVGRDRGPVERGAGRGNAGAVRAGCQLASPTGSQRARGEAALALDGLPQRIEALRGKRGDGLSQRVGLLTS